MKNLYSFYVDCGRMGELEGLFVASPKEVEEVVGKEAYFGEVLGKHSEVDIQIMQHHIGLVSDDQEKVEWLESVIGCENISGFNPLDYIEEGE